MVFDCLLVFNFIYVIHKKRGALRPPLCIIKVVCSLCKNHLQNMFCFVFYKSYLVKYCPNLYATPTTVPIAKALIKLAFLYLNLLIGLL